MVFFSTLPRCPAVDPHTADPQRPLERHKVGCRTMWPEASRAEKNSQIQNLHRRKKNQTKKQGEVVRLEAPKFDSTI